MFKNGITATHLRHPVFRIALLHDPNVAELQLSDRLDSNSEQRSSRSTPGAAAVQQTQTITPPPLCLTKGMTRRLVFDKRVDVRYGQTSLFYSLLSKYGAPEMFTPMQMCKPTSRCRVFLREAFLR